MTRDLDDQIEQWRPYGKRLAARWCVRNNVYSPQGQEDVQADALVGIWEALATFDPARGPLVPHIHRRVQYAIVDGYRYRYGRNRAARHIAHPMYVEPENIEAVGGELDEGGFDDVEFDDLLDRCCKTLEPRLARILRGRVAGRYHRELAAELGGTPELICKLTRGPLAAAVAAFLARVA